PHAAQSCDTKSVEHSFYGIHDAAGHLNFPTGSIESPHLKEIAISSGSRFRSSPAARCEHSLRAARPDCGRGRVRPSVARKERQIYSLLVLATHPPVRTGEISKEGHGASAKFEKTQRHFHTCF